MTSEDKHQIDKLQEQLNNARQSAEDTRTYLLSILGRTNDEARMYRGLFWCLLGLGLVALTFRFLQN